MRTITILYFAAISPNEELVKALTNSDSALRVIPTYAELCAACTGEPTIFVVVDLRHADEATLEEFGTAMDPIAAQQGANALLIVDDPLDTTIADQYDLRALLEMDATPARVLDALAEMIEETELDAVA